jgi:sugar phosphate isomerase/epimerase
MRLGYNWGPTGPDDLDRAAAVADEFGLGTVAAPSAETVLDWSVPEARAYGEAVRERGLTVGELGYWDNIFDGVADLREVLRRGDAMGADCVVSLVGSFAGGGGPHPDNYGEAARERATEQVRAALDGLPLDRTTYALEPWYDSFFHQPRPVREFLDRFDRVGVHLDVANLHCVGTVHRSETVVGRAFDLLADDAAAVHAKDLTLDPGGVAEVCTLREVPPGETDGSLAFDQFLERLDDLPDDVPVFTEHWPEDGQYERAVAWLHERADALGTAVVEREA